MDANGNQQKAITVNCPNCASLMGEAARVCPTCRMHKSWWRNHFRVEHFGLLLTIGIIWIGSSNLKEARNDRNEARTDRQKAKEALDRAQAVEKTVGVVENEVRSLTGKISDAQRQIETITTLVKASEQGSNTIADTLAYVRTLQLQIDNARKELSKLDKKIEENVSRPPIPILTFDSAGFQSTEAGVVGLVSFKSNTNVNLSAVEFKVSVLPGGASRIKSISPGEGVSLMVSTRISEDGQSAYLKYTVVGSEKPSFRIELTGKAQLRIEGEPGIRPFAVVIDK